MAGCVACRVRAAHMVRHGQAVSPRSVETVGRQVTLTVGVSQRRRKKQAESRRSLSLISAAAIVFVADRVTATQIRQLRRHFETIDGRIDHYIVNSESMAQEHSYSNR